MNSEAKPRLLFFNGPWDYLSERMRRSFITPFQRLLEQDFQVISLEGNRCFRREVEAHHPDIVLFHTGCEAPGEPEVEISELDAFPDVPRIGYMFRDPFSPSRMMPMNRLRAWGVHQIFTAARTTDSASQYFRDTIYVPWWIDDSIYRDYGERKMLPLTLTGAGWLNRCIYTWRSEVFRQLVTQVPIFHAPSLGNRQNGHDFHGESYVRLLNRSCISAGCGSVNRYLTLKLLEIPAARCCLLAEESEVLKAIGFKDGVNCIFADSGTVVGKVQGLLADKARLQAITDAGYELVHSRHTQRHRRMFIDWFRLWQVRQPGQRIVQTHPLEPLRLVDRDKPPPCNTFPSENPMLATQCEGYQLLASGNWIGALERFNWVINIVPCVAEARLGAALCLLRLGRAAEARQHLAYNVSLMTQHFGNRHPDPIDAACLAALLFRLKDTVPAVALLRDFPAVRHPALNAMRWIVARSSAELAKLPVFQIQEGDESETVESVHVLSQRTFVEWVALLKEFLR